MEILQAVVFSGIIARVLCTYYYNTSNALTEVPSNIPSDAWLVDLSTNQISSLDGKLDHIADLQHLYLGLNRITSCPNLLQIGQTLKGLVLTYNGMSKEEVEKCLGYLTRIEHLRLEGTFRTSGIPDFSAVGTTLKKLEIGMNNIEVIGGQLDKLDELELLWLQGNDLKTFPDLAHL